MQCFIVNRAQSPSVYHTSERLRFHHWQICPGAVPE